MGRVNTIDIGLLSEYTGGMSTLPITEDAFKAVITTCWNLNAAVSDLTRQVEAANEAIIILSHRVDDVEQRTRPAYT